MFRVRSFGLFSCPSAGLGSVSGRILLPVHIVSRQNVSFTGNICSPHWAFGGDLKCQEGSRSNNVLQDPSHRPGWFPCDCFHFHHQSKSCLSHSLSSLAGPNESATPLISRRHCSPEGKQSLRDEKSRRRKNHLLSAWQREKTLLNAVAVCPSKRDLLLGENECILALNKLLPAVAEMAFIWNVLLLLMSCSVVRASC